MKIEEFKQGVKGRGLPGWEKIQTMNYSTLLETLQGIEINWVLQKNVLANNENVWNLIARSLAKLYQTVAVEQSLVDSQDETVEGSPQEGQETSSGKGHDDDPNLDPNIGLELILDRDHSGEEVINTETDRLEALEMGPDDLETEGPVPEPSPLREAAEQAVPSEDNSVASVTLVGLAIGLIGGVMLWRFFGK